MGCSSAHTHIEGLKRMRRCQLGELGVRRAVGELFGDTKADAERQRESEHGSTDRDSSDSTAVSRARVGQNMVVPFPARAPRARGRSFAAERVGVATLDLYRCLASRFRRGSAPSADGDARWTVRSRDVHPRGYQL